MSTTIILANGEKEEVQLQVSMYREAQDQGLSLPQFINRRYGSKVNSQRDGTPFDQLCVASGLLLSSDSQLGLRPPTVRDAMNGNAQMMAVGSITRDPNPASRILFPAIAIAATEAALRDNNNSFISLFDRLVGRVETIAGEKFEQPIIDFSAIDNDPPKPMPIAQGALPHGMPQIKASDVTRRIPHYSIGLEITEQAQAITSLPLVAATLTRQAEHYRYSIVLDAINSLINGDTDIGYSALPVVELGDYDTAMVTGGITHKAWIKFLMNKYRKRQIDWVMCDFDTALKLESRTGKPTVQGDDPTSPRIDAMFNIVNPQWQSVQMLMVPDGVIPSDTIVGLDTRWAIWKVESSTVNYQAVEEFVLRRVTAMRFDLGFMYLRQFDDAWDVGTLVQ